MRTNIDIDDALLKTVMTRSGMKTKKEAVHDALRTKLRLMDQGDAIRSLRGIGWEGDLEEMRTGRKFEPVG